MTGLKLFDFQAVGAGFLATARQGLLSDDMGLGKTTSTLHAARALYEAGENPFPMLVICPNSVKPSWKREAEAWWPGLKAVVVKGSAAQRRAIMEEPAHIYIINWESLRLHSRLAPYGSISLKRCKECGGEDERVTTARCEVHARELNQLKFKTVVADEAHRCKDPSAKQTRALWAIGDGAEFRFALTGTPIANAPDDLWAIMRFLSPSEFPARTRYIQRWCTPAGSPVLMADGTVERIENVKIGDLVAGFPRQVKKSYSQKIEPAEVQSVNVHEAEIVRATTDAGRVFYCTPDHEWMDARRYLRRDEDRNHDKPGTSEALGNRLRWPVCECGVETNAGSMAVHLRKTGHALTREYVPLDRNEREARAKERRLTYKDRKEVVFRRAEVGMRVVPVHDLFPWIDDDPELLRAAAWLGGVHDGEGTGGLISQKREANPDVWEEIGRVLKTLDIQHKSSDVAHQITGGRSELIKFYTYCQPVKRNRVFTRPSYSGNARLLGAWLGVKPRKGTSAGNTWSQETITSIEPAGSAEVYSLTTSTGTYVVNGLASSNCAQAYNVFGQPTVIGLKPETRDEFYRIVNPRMRRMPKDLVLDFLPPIIPIVREVPMLPEQQKAYDSMRDNMLAELDSGEVMITTSPLTRLTRLVQFASAYATLTEPDESGAQRAILSEPSNKLDAFMDDFESGDFGDSSIIVFAQSRQLIELLSARLEKKGVDHGLITGAISEDDRQRYIDEFQAGKFRLMLVTIQAGGVGLTLTKAKIRAFLQRSWSLIDQKQAEARNHRIGSEMHDSIIHIDYVSPGTVEEQQLAALEGKGERLEEILRDRDVLGRMLADERAKADAAKPARKRKVGGSWDGSAEGLVAINEAIEKGAAT